MIIVILTWQIDCECVIYILDLIKAFSLCSFPIIDRKTSQASLLTAAALHISKMKIINSNCLFKNAIMFEKGFLSIKNIRYIHFGIAEKQDGADTSFPISKFSWLDGYELCHIKQLHTHM